MFTGIIQDIGTIERIQPQGDNVNLVIKTAKLIDDIKIGDSVSVSGVCLTATKITPRARQFEVAAVAETLRRTTLIERHQGSRVNLELALRPSDRLGGHFVQGHIDAVGRLESVNEQGGSWLMRYSYPAEFSNLLIEKGSIAIDGVSLTAYDKSKSHFTVSVVPHTWDATTFSTLKAGESVNLEFDLIGKYILNRITSSAQEGLTIEKMIELGF